MRPLIRKGGMNRQEENYSSILKLLQAAGEVLDWRYEPFGLKLAEMRCYYHPDFLVVYQDHFEVHEVKGFNKQTRGPRYEDDAIVKIKVAAKIFPFWEFKLVWFDGSNWQDRPIKA